MAEKSKETRSTLGGANVSTENLMPTCGNLKRN